MVEKILSTARKFLLKINKINQKQWLICSIFTTTTGVWFSLILSFFGQSLNLLKVAEDGSKSFTTLGIILTALTVGWSMLSLIAQRYSDYHNRNLGITQEDLGEIETVYETLNSSASSVVEHSVLEKTKYIEDVLNNRDTLREPIDKPCIVLKKITSELITVSSKLLSYKKHNIRDKDLYVGIYYNFPLEDENKWYRADNTRQKRGLAIEDLFKPNTTFFDVLNNPQSFVFYNDKETAKRQKHYVPDSEDSYDNSDKLVGSIACFKYDITNENTYVKFIVSIASYGKRFSKSNDDTDIKNIANNFKYNVMPEYEMLIKNAFCDFYIMHLIHKNKDDEQQSK